MLVLCLALAACGTALVSMAYLVDTDETVNTFTVGQVHINLDEAAVNPDGTPILDQTTGNPAPRVAGNEYHLIPGQTYVKDPTMTVLKGSEEAWVRMTVTLSHASTLQNIFGTGFLPETYAEGWDPALWRCVGITQDAAKDTLTYEFRYKEKVKPQAGQELKLEPLFTHFKAPGELDGEDLKALSTKGGFKITVMGHAIQAAGFGAEDLAWTGFDEQYAREQAGA